MDRGLWTGDREVGERRAEEVEGVAEIGFVDGAGFYGEGESVGVGGDADGGDLQQFLLKVLSPELLGIFDF